MVSTEISSDVAGGMSVYPHIILVLLGLIVVDVSIFRVFIDTEHLNSYTFFLGISNYEYFLHTPGVYNDTQNAVMGRALHSLMLRVNLSNGNTEELWFATLKLGEIHARFRNDWPKAQRFFDEAFRLDNTRSDPLFHIGQHYRTAGEYIKAFKYLKDAVNTPVPAATKPYMWLFLHNCLAHVELARAYLELAKAATTTRHPDDHDMVQNSLSKAKSQCPKSFQEELNTITESLPSLSTRWEQQQRLNKNQQPSECADGDKKKKKKKNKDKDNGNGKDAQQDDKKKKKKKKDSPSPEPTKDKTTPPASNKEQTESCTSKDPNGNCIDGNAKDKKKKKDKKPKKKKKDKDSKKSKTADEEKPISAPEDSHPTHTHSHQHDDPDNGTTPPQYGSGGYGSSSDDIQQVIGDHEPHPHSGYVWDEEEFVGMGDQASSPFHALLSTGSSEVSPQTYKERLSKARDHQPQAHTSAFDISILSEFLSFVIDEMLDKLAHPLQQVYADTIINRSASAGGLGAGGSWFYRMDLLENFSNLLSALQEVINITTPSCEDYQQAYQPYSAFVTEHENLILHTLQEYKAVEERWANFHRRIAHLCPAPSGK
eukprot:TRINITY_DN66122_c5_g1_i1.p1 TRINITY_DN66122_c5_g1~~TRINITY_DN66122_c5_g1_i1.p1  ORF type:complete len:597 (+),score=40.95 TRINITY_DN66122_c5_g1_i1:1-1791(+)